jgi:hypothetical protein
VIDSIEHSIQRLAELTGVSVQTEVTAFLAWQNIGPQEQGIYIIYDADTVYYVGKGQIRARQDKHVQKAHNRLRTARDTVAWAWLREHQEINTEGWQCLRVAGLGHTARAAFEGMLIHWLQPLANDEVYLDRQGGPG